MNIISANGISNISLFNDILSKSQAKQKRKNMS